MTSDYAPLLSTLLEADTTLMALLTGGIYLETEIQPEGITRTSVPAAYDSDGWLKPLLRVRGRAVIPFGVFRDRTAKTVTQRQAVELYLQQDGDSGFDALETAYSRIFTLLEQARVTRGQVQWGGESRRFYDPETNGAATLKTEFTVTGLSG